MQVVRLNVRRTSFPRSACALHVAVAVLIDWYHFECGKYRCCGFNLFLYRGEKTLAASFAAAVDSLYCYEVIAIAP